MPVPALPLTIIFTAVVVSMVAVLVDGRLVLPAFAFVMGALHVAMHGRFERRRARRLSR